MRRPIARLAPRGTFSSFLRPEVFGSLTAAQRALAHVAFDGADPVSLALRERASARAMFGDVERIDPLARGVLALVKGARVGGTWLRSLRLLQLGWSCDLSRLAPGERAFGLIVAPDLRLAR